MRIALLLVALAACTPEPVEAHPLAVSIEEFDCSPDRRPDAVGDYTGAVLVTVEVCRGGVACETEGYRIEDAVLTVTGCNKTTDFARVRSIR